MNTPPFAYVVIDWRGDEDGVYPTLAALVQGQKGAIFSDMLHVDAVYRDGGRCTVPREAYQRPDPPSREESLEFVRTRTAEIAEERARSSERPTFAEMKGLLRCSADDPEEKQVEDYRRTAPWAWRDDPDEEWWRGTL